MAASKCLALLVFTIALAASLPFSSDPAWEKYKSKYKKTYKDDDDEVQPCQRSMSCPTLLVVPQAARHNLFTVAKYRVAQLNKLNGQPAFGINWMSE